MGILKALRSLGQAPYGAEAPAGYPETAEAWLDGGALEARVRVAREIAERIPLPDGFAHRPAGGEAAEAVSRSILDRLVPAGASPELTGAVRQAVLASGPREGLALALASPDFQRR